MPWGSSWNQRQTNQMAQWGQRNNPASGANSIYGQQPKQYGQVGNVQEPTAGDPRAGEWAAMRANGAPEEMIAAFKAGKTYREPSRESAFRQQQAQRKAMKGMGGGAGAGGGFGGQAANQMVGQMAGMGGQQQTPSPSPERLPDNTPWKNQNLTPQQRAQQTQALYEKQAKEGYDASVKDYADWESKNKPLLDEASKYWATNLYENANYTAEQRGELWNKWKQEHGVRERPKWNPESWKDYAKKGGWDVSSGMKW